MICFGWFQCRVDKIRVEAQDGKIHYFRHPEKDASDLAWEYFNKFVENSNIRVGKVHFEVYSMFEVVIYSMVNLRGCLQTGRTYAYMR